MLPADVDTITSSSIFQIEVPHLRNVTVKLRRNAPLDEPTIANRNDGQSTATVNFIITSWLLFDIHNCQTMLKIILYYFIHARHFHFWYSVKFYASGKLECICVN